MRTKKIVGGVVLIATLILASILFVIVRPSPPPLTIRHVKSVQSSGGVEMTFEITNHTTGYFSLDTVSVEARDGSGWKECLEFGPSVVLRPHGLKTSTGEMTTLPTGSPLRLRLLASKVKMGLGTIPRRLDLRFLKGQKDVPLNPFDRRIFFGESTQVVSDEFSVPGPETTSKANSEK